ncbi:MAG: PilZ domain-containing protein [Desulfobacterales bacterium]
MMNINNLKTDQIYATATSDQREYPRVATCNLISYTAVNRSGDPSDQRMGRALDVSQTGIYLETARKVKSEFVSLLTSDIKENLIEIKGRVAYSRENGAGTFRTGIRFEGTRDENIGFAKQLIRVYHNRRTGYHISTDRSASF